VTCNLSTCQYSDDEQSAMEGVHEWWERRYVDETLTSQPRYWSPKLSEGIEVSRIALIKTLVDAHHSSRHILRVG
jgi:hypothetical protein